MQGHPTPNPVSGDAVTARYRRPIDPRHAGKLHWRARRPVPAIDSVKTSGVPDRPRWGNFTWSKLRGVARQQLPLVALLEPDEERVELHLVAVLAASAVEDVTHHR